MFWRRRTGRTGPLQRFHHQFYFEVEPVKSLDHLQQFDKKIQRARLSQVTSRKSANSAPPLAGLSKFEVENTPLTLAKLERKAAIWGDGDSRLHSTRACSCCRNFDSLQSLATRRLVLRARHRLGCRPPPPATGRHFRCPRRSVSRRRHCQHVG
jgi:hypothetical protein